MSATSFRSSRRRPRWILLPLLVALTAPWMAAATFPLPIPTRPTTFPLTRPTNEGVIMEWGENRAGPGATSSVPAGLTGVVAISDGTSHAVALRADGTVVAFGRNEDNAGRTNVPVGLSNIVSVSAGRYHSLALRNDGRVFAWGSSVAGRTAVPPGLIGVVAVSAGYNHNLALRWDGNVIGFGASDFGQATPPPALNNAVGIAAGEFHSLALRGDGTVVAWGRNSDGESDPPKWLRDVVAIAAGDGFSLALRYDGSIVHWGKQSLAPPATLDLAIALSATHNHALAVQSKGTVVAWGQQDCCSGATTTPDGLRGVISVAAGSFHNLVLFRASPPSPSATAASQIVNGFLVGVSVTNPGLGYTTAPEIRVEGGGGTGAVLVPVIENGRVISITVENPGRGYTSAPQIIIAPPLLPPPALTVAVSRIVVRQQVVPGMTYQLESSSDLQSWLPVGGPFVAETALEQREIEVGDGALHFRLTPLP